MSFSASSLICFIKKLFSGVTKYSTKITYLPTSEIAVFSSLIGLLDPEDKSSMIL
jgi:hypothetical protein